MSQGYPHPHPPPPPASPGLAVDSQRRRLPLQPPTITTALTAAQRLGHHLVPNTPTGGRSPFSPAVASPHPPSAVSLASPMSFSRGSSAATATYNPQEWSRGGAVNGSYVPHTTSNASRRLVGTRDATGMEAALPSPPPPYSASPRSGPSSSRSVYPSPNAPSFSSQTTSPTNYPSDYNTPISAATSVSPGGVPSFNRSNSQDAPAAAAQQPSPTSFPPPPAAAPQARDRSTSQSRFGLTAIATRHRANNSGSPSSAIEALQQQTSAALSRTPQHVYANPTLAASTVTPPTARRAVSVGSIGTTSGQSHLPSGSSTPVIDAAGNYGFALPPPPPGPPPSSRSQSMSRVGDINSSHALDGNPIAAPFPSKAALQNHKLGPIPPTPVDWVEEDSIRRPTPSASMSQTTRPAFGSANVSDPLRTSANSELQHNPSENAQAATSTACETSNIRGSIRDRRTESRASKTRSVSREPDSVVNDSEQSAHGELEAARPADLVLTGSSNSALGRRRHVSKSKISPVLHGRTSPQVQRARIDAHSNDVESTHGSALTTPYSARSAREQDSPASGRPSAASPDSTATSTRPSMGPAPITGDGAFLRIGDKRIDDRSASPLVPARSGSQKDGTSESAAAPLSGFSQASLERHLRFIELESRASSDVERLQLFSQYIVAESRLRREKYSIAFDRLGSDVLDLTRDLWRPLASTNQSRGARNESATSANPFETPQTLGEPRDIADGSSAGSAPNSATFTPKTEPESDSNPSQAGRLRSDSQRQNSFQPILSPIPSMAMSTIADDEDSRGRTASRWWESSTDAGSLGGDRRLERSKRESKYMSLPKQARENLQWSIPEDSPGMPGPSQDFYALGPNEYPAEKTALHEERIATPEYAQYAPRERTNLAMDVSRLITLPPPYPRHHPAVNNNHPDLAHSRAMLRSLGDRGQAAEVRRQFSAALSTATEIMSPDNKANEGRMLLRKKIQEQINIGKMSFAEAAREEAAFEARELKRSRNQAKEDFDRFQSLVVAPLNALYKERLKKATELMGQLRDSLSDEARSHNPNQTQEEGDEQPELLEKLTLLKWLHEAREHLYRDLFELEGESDERYKSVILLPYRQAANKDKIYEVESFFAKDIQERRVRFEKDVQQRFEDFLRTMEQNVTRGVEVQISAFWDIAPPLLAVIQNIPGSLEGFEIQIPPHEYEESPSYNAFPMQYLYSILQHAHKSAYQFIESQVNLLCLLHEAKTAVMMAGCKLMETQRHVSGEDARMVEVEMEEIRKSEDASLTADLKERVELVEDQWRQALGKGLLECEDRIKKHLIAQGGWDESLEE